MQAHSLDAPRLSENDIGGWIGGAVFVIGGGRSVSDLDMMALRKCHTLGINDAAWHLPFVPSMHFACDYPYWRSEARAGTLLECLRVWVRPYADHPQPPGITHYVPILGESHWSTAWGSSLAGIGVGGHSGFAAINLADVLGASVIYLLGFDMNDDDTDRTRWRESLETAAPSIRARVVNLNPDSRLECFEKQDPSKWLS